MTEDTNKDSDRELFPGEIRGHGTDPEGRPDVGFEVGLGKGRTLYIGELARDTLDDAGVPAEFASGRFWWVALICGASITPVAMTVPSRDGNEVEELIGAIASAIRGSMVARVQDLLSEAGGTEADRQKAGLEDMAEGLDQKAEAIRLSPEWIRRPRHPITRGIE